MKIGEFDLKQRRLNKSLINRQAKRYIESNPRLKGVMGLYREVFSVQRRLSQRVPDQLPHIKGGQISYRIAEGRLLIEPDELEVDLPVLKEMMGELGKVLRDKSGSPVENLEMFLEEELEDEERLRNLVEAFLQRNGEDLAGIADGYSLDPAVLYLLLHISIAPFFWKKAGSLARKADLGQVPRGECPVCGNLPVMGFLRSEDGLRILECSLCGSRWGVPRVMCPFCKNMDQHKLRYIFAEGDSSHRVYLCDKCRKYIKITGEAGETTEELVMPLEDLATVHLDQAAEERGYERGCRTVFS
jgi:FdhE protein